MYMTKTCLTLFKSKGMLSFGKNNKFRTKFDKKKYSMLECL